METGTEGGTAIDPNATRITPAPAPAARRRALGGRGKGGGAPDTTEKPTGPDTTEKPPVGDPAVKPVVPATEKPAAPDVRTGSAAEGGGGGTSSEETAEAKAARELAAADEVEKAKAIKKAAEAEKAEAAKAEAAKKETAERAADWKGAKEGAAPAAGTVAVSNPVAAAAATGFNLAEIGDDSELDFGLSDVDPAKLKLKILLYGDTGAGKTHFSADADGVAVALVEPQGFATIASLKRKVLVPGKKGRAGTPCLRTMDDLREFVKAAASGRLAKAGVTTLVFDGITEIQQMMIDEIQRGKRRAALTVKTEGSTKKTKAVETEAKPDAKPDAKTKGPAPEMTQADWGTLATMLRNFLRTIRDLPYHVIVTALSQTSEDEVNGVKIRRLSPMLSGSTRATIGQYFNIIGLIYKIEESGTIRRVVAVDADERYMTKSYGAIVGIVDANLALWLELLAGGDGTAAAAGARLPGQVKRRLGGTKTTKTEETEEEEEEDEGGNGSF